MSSKNTKKVENKDFIERFEEACGSSKPTEVARLLKVTYQAASNYLKGRIPESNVLLTIAEETPYSIHWLLTGKGKKFAEVESSKKTKIELSREVKNLIKAEVQKTVNEILNITEVEEEKKSVVIKSTDIKQERVDDKVNSSSSDDDDS